MYYITRNDLPEHPLTIHRRARLGHAYGACYKEKKQPDKKQRRAHKPKSEKTPFKADLHDQLLDTAGMTNAEMLDYQLQNSMRLCRKICTEN